MKAILRHSKLCLDFRFESFGDHLTMQRRSRFTVNNGLIAEISARQQRPGYKHRKCPHESNALPRRALSRLVDRRVCCRRNTAEQILK
jgi:hypothetical protein